MYTVRACTYGERVCVFVAVAVPERSQHVPAGLQEVAVMCVLARRRNRLLPGITLTPLVRWRYCAFRHPSNLVFVACLRTVAVM